MNFCIISAIKQVLTMVPFLLVPYIPPPFQVRIIQTGKKLIVVVVLDDADVDVNKKFCYINVTEMFSK